MGFPPLNKNSVPMRASCRKSSKIARMFPRLFLDWGLIPMDAPEIFYSLVENTCRDLYIKSLKEIPPDVVEAIRQAAKRETKEVGRRIFSHYLQSIELGRKQDMMVCQDTGIPIYWVEIGGNLRLDGAKLSEAIVRGTERATREHPLRSSIVSPITRENRQTSCGERIPSSITISRPVRMRSTSFSCPKAPARKTCRS